MINYTTTINDLPSTIGRCYIIKNTIHSYQDRDTPTWDIIIQFNLAMNVTDSQPRTQLLKNTIVVKPRNCNDDVDHLSNFRLCIKNLRN